MVDISKVVVVVGVLFTVVIITFLEIWVVTVGKMMIVIIPIVLTAIVIIVVQGLFQHTDLGH